MTVGEIPAAVTEVSRGELVIHFFCVELTNFNKLDAGNTVINLLYDSYCYN